MTLNDLRDEALRIAVEHGFTDATIGEDLMLMVSELAELLEDHREGRKPAEVWYEEKLLVAPPPGERWTRVRIHSSMDPLNEGDDGRHTLPLAKPCGIPSELADVLIRVFHFCGKHGIDIDKAVREKMAFNASRPFKHGGKKL
jgi:NTP pyrophosphatase (non-canonical NTP hydrolase)